MGDLGRALLLLSILNGGAPKPPDPPRGYASPQEAFQARKAALARRDWRTAYASLTPDAQDEAVMQIAQVWLWLQSDMETPWDHLGKAGRKAAVDKSLAVLKKHGLERRTFEAEYFKRYRAAHGVDLGKILEDRRKRNRERIEVLKKEKPEEAAEWDKLLAEHPEVLDQDPAELDESLKPGPPTPEPDGSLLGEAIESILVDKEGLYMEATELLSTRLEAPGKSPFGDLQGLTVVGDVARGWVLWTHYGGVNGKRFQFEPVRVERLFRKRDGRWFNDNLDDDTTRFDPEDSRKPREAAADPAPNP